jgi:hypothetical protein
LLFFARWSLLKNFFLLGQDSAKILAESQSSLMEILATPAGKKKYMKWLFRLADADNKGRVNVEELSMILRALAMDGLAMSELVFEQGEGCHFVLFSLTQRRCPNDNGLYGHCTAHYGRV